MSVAGPASEPPSVAAARLLEILEDQFGRGLEAARDPHARRPRPEAEALRLAYLDVLKLCLCDLGGTRTTSVTRTFSGEVMSRELEGDQLRFRTAGMDWPLHGLTMVGLARLDDLQACVEQLVRDQVPGDLIEAGSWRGGASILTRATLDSLGADDRTLWVADSFQGFPPAEAEGDGYDLRVDLAGVDFLAAPLDEVKQSFARFGVSDGVAFVPGFFEDTLPTMKGRRWSMVRLDGDTYEATWLSLEILYPGLQEGGFLIVDDYLQIEPCRKAVDEFRRAHGINEPLEEVDWSGARWRRETPPDPAPEMPLEPASADHRPPIDPVPRSPVTVPTISEVELRHELEHLQVRLVAAEAEVARLSISPLEHPRAWLRNQIATARQRRR